MAHCLNCGTPLVGKYCYQCGQKNFTKKDKSIRSLLGEAFHFITHFEGKFFTTIRTIFSRPGSLSYDYSRGIRQKYYKPVSLFLLVVIIYLLFPLFPGLNMEMKYYKTLPLSGSLISGQITKKLHRDKITETQLVRSFEAKSHTTSKFLLFLMIPLAALGLRIFYFNKNRLLYDDFILATEMNIFYIISFFLLLPFLFRFMYMAFKVNLNDFSVGIVIQLFFICYLSIVFKKIFGQKWALTILKAFFFSLLFAIFIQVVYKFIMFEITFFLL